MKHLLILLTVTFLITESVYGQYKSNYHIRIITKEGKRFKGKFIRMNDSVLSIKKQTGSAFFMTFYKRKLTGFRADEVSSMVIYHRGGRPVGQFVGGGVGVVGSILLGRNLSGDISQVSGKAALLILISSVVLGFAGGEVGHAMSVKLRLNDLELTDFSSISERLEPYQAQLRKHLN